MPRPTTQRITGADAPAPQGQAEDLRPVASPTNTYVSPGENEYQQLADGLARMQPSLARMSERQDHRDEQYAIDQGLAAAAKEQQPGLVKDNAQPPVNPLVAPAFTEQYARAFQKGLGQRLGQEEHDSYLDAFAQEYQKEGFDKKSFDATYRAKALAGVADPLLQTEMAGSIDKAIGSSDAIFRELQLKRTVDERNTQLSTKMRAITPTTQDDDAMSLFQQISKDHTLAGGTRAEAAHALVSHMAALSTALGGRPDLFNVFSMDVPGLGKKITDLVPGLEDKVSDEMRQAHDLQEKELIRNSVGTNAEILTDIKRKVTDGTYARMSDEDVMRELKQYQHHTGALAHPAATAEIMGQVYQQRQALAQRAQTADMMNSGLGGLITDRHTAEDAIDAALSVPLQNSGMSVKGALVASINDPTKAPLMDAALSQIIAIHDKSKVAFPDKTIKGLIDSSVLSIPKPGEAPSPQFTALSKLYASLEQRSKPLLNAYFDGRAKDVFSAYNGLTVEGQASTASALQQAYAMSDPDNIKDVHERLDKDPAFRADLQSKVLSASRGWFGGGGTAGLARWIPGAQLIGVNRPETGALERAAMAEAKRYALYSPGVSADDITKHAQQWASANFFYSKSAGSYVQIPPALNSSATQDAVDNYLSIVAGQKENKGVTPTLQSKGNGVYDLVFVSKSGAAFPEIASTNVTLDSIMRLHAAQTQFTDPERETLSTMVGKLRDGTATAEDIKASQPVLTKARALGVWSPDLDERAKNTSTLAATTALSTQIEPALKAAVARSSSLSQLGMGAGVVAKPNGSSTAAVAQQFMGMGNPTAALTTLSEGVALTAYKDPARGTNIGMGYNMDANAKTIESDFKSAGIPPELIGDIRDGKRQITPDQAMRLYQVVQPRYEGMARSAVEKQYPGEWNKLSDNVKAVLTDIAYQAGDVGKFRTGLANLFNGDLSGRGLEVSYTQRDTGNRVIDARRHTLRTAMLQSTSNFQTLLGYASKQPQNALQSRAVVASATGGGGPQ